MMAGARTKTLIALTVMGLLWLPVLFKLGLWHATLKPVGGVLSYTFNGWEGYPATRHLFLAQYEPDTFARGEAYTSYTYPFLLFNFLLLAPFRFLLKLPYEVAHNFIPYFYVLCLTSILTFSRKEHLRAVLEKKSPLLWILAFISVGIFVTDPLPWVSLLDYNRDNFHVLAAGAFCYLSTWVFRDEVPERPLLAVGIFLALWSPIYIPAWILAGIFFKRALAVERRWVLQVAGVSAAAGINIILPWLVCHWAGVRAGGSGFLYRSGLDGSERYMTTIVNAASSPVDPRHWPAAFYFLTAAFAGVGFHYWFKKRGRYRPLQQAFFLLIPYATIAISLPQFTSIHPYFADLLLFIPATFLVSFWFLQKEFWENLTGKTYVAWALVAGLILMTNLLTVAQNMRR